MLNTVKSALAYSYEVIFVSLLTGHILYEIVFRLSFLLKQRCLTGFFFPKFNNKILVCSGISASLGQKCSCSCIYFIPFVYFTNKEQKPNI